MESAQTLSRQAMAQRVLVTQVNPFEDVPGYQLLALLADDPDIGLDICDDSTVAVDILSQAGYNAMILPHPYNDPSLFSYRIQSLLAGNQYDIVFPGSDAHLFAMAALFATSEQVRRSCPALDWIVQRGLASKWDLQEWIAAHVPTPRRWRTPEDVPTSLRADRGIVIKGALKECRPVDTWGELPALIRQLSDNPANSGPEGPVYFEEYLPGPEFCILLAHTGSEVESVLLRKLASTRSGTTMVGELKARAECPFDLEWIEDGMLPGMALELEWIESRNGPSVFEVNPRFPSWLGALGPFGRALLKRTIGAIRGVPAIARAPKPAAGTRIVRLPHSGTLGSVPPMGTERGLLWDSAAPHRFIVK